MNLLGLAALAIGPGAILLHRAYARDLHREPASNVLVYALLGALVVVPVALIEAIAHPLFGTANASTGSLVLRLGLWAVLGVALVEELGKRVALNWRARRDRHIDEPFDWIVYSVAVSLGFATLENVLYVFQHGAGVGVLRAFTAVPSHALDGTMMGWHLARASVTSGAQARTHRWLAILEPVAWHGAYDGLLFVANAGDEVLAENWRQRLIWCWVLLLACQVKVAMDRVSIAAKAARAPTPPILAVHAAIRHLRSKRHS